MFRRFLVRGLLATVLGTGCGGGSSGYYWPDDGEADGGSDAGTDAGKGGGKDGGKDAGATTDAAATSPDLALPVDLKAAAPDLASDGWPPAWSALEEAILVETNLRRGAGATCGGKKFGPVGPLTMHPALRKSARLHSQDMATQNYFSHTSLDGRSPFTRMKAAGFMGGTMGENIAAGNPTAAQTMTQWMNSPGHCENIMQPGYHFLGVGYALGNNSQYKHYWTQNFGG
ncbi:MAG: CAP domain-containing protein [Myxococcales bacterium]|nr:CAP domain-containing protein [Myxococcales bacterium]